VGVEESTSIPAHSLLIRGLMHRVFNRKHTHSLGLNGGRAAPCQKVRQRDIGDGDRVSSSVPLFSIEKTL